MEKERLVAFTDGVIAVIITIMVLELKVPHETDLAALWTSLPVFLSYALSFVYVGVYWVNHHHLFCLVDRVSGSLLWANLHFLFWLSLIPFGTGWIGEHHEVAAPVAVYGFLLLAPAMAWLALQHIIVRSQGPSSRLARAIGSDVKGKISSTLYVAGIALAFVLPTLSEVLYAVVAVMWLVPDRRLAAEMTRGAADHPAGERRPVSERTRCRPPGSADRRLPDEGDPTRASQDVSACSRAAVLHRT